MQIYKLLYTEFDYSNGCIKQTKYIYIYSCVSLKISPPKLSRSYTLDNNIIAFGFAFISLKT